MAAALPEGHVPGPLGIRDLPVAARPADRHPRQSLPIRPDRRTGSTFRLPLDRSAVRATFSGRRRRDSSRRCRGVGCETGSLERTGCLHEDACRPVLPSSASGFRLNRTAAGQSPRQSCNPRNGKAVDDQEDHLCPQRSSPRRRQEQGRRGRLGECRTDPFGKAGSPRRRSGTRDPAGAIGAGSAGNQDRGPAARKAGRAGGKDAALGPGQGGKPATAGKCGEPPRSSAYTAYTAYTSCGACDIAINTAGNCRRSVSCAVASPAAGSDTCSDASRSCSAGTRTQTGPSGRCCRCRQCRKRRSVQNGLGGQGHRQGQRDER